MQEEEQGYGAVAKTLHWLIVALLIAQYAAAWTMPEPHRGAQPEALMNFHFSLGCAILFVALVRMIWRVANRVPVFSENMPRWQVVAAHSVHGMLYLLLAVLPVLGWASASAHGWKVTMFGLFDMPPLLTEGGRLGHNLGEIHGALAAVLLVLAGLHVAAALYHRFILRDGMLARMLPRS